jgi:hypothetical protein
MGKSPRAETEKQSQDLPAGTDPEKKAKSSSSDRRLFGRRGFLFWGALVIGFLVGIGLVTFWELCNYYVVSFDENCFKEQMLSFCRKYSISGDKISKITFVIRDSNVKKNDNPSTVSIRLAHYNNNYITLNGSCSDDINSTKNVIFHELLHQLYEKTLTEDFKKRFSAQVDSYYEQVSKNKHEVDDLRKQCNDLYMKDLRNDKFWRESQRIFGAMLEREFYSPKDIDSFYSVNRKDYEEAFATLFEYYAFPPQGRNLLNNPGYIKFKTHFKDLWLEMKRVPHTPVKPSDIKVVTCTAENFGRLYIKNLKKTLSITDTGQLHRLLFTAGIFQEHR